MSDTGDGYRKDKGRTGNERKSDRIQPLLSLSSSTQLNSNYPTLPFAGVPRQPDPTQAFAGRHHRSIQLKQITFQDGDIELNAFPAHLRSQLQAYCNEKGYWHIGDLITNPFKANSTRDSREGRTTFFRASKSSERLLTARFTYGDDEINVVKERVGLSINNGKAVLIHRAKDKVPRLTTVNGVAYTLFQCRVWHPQDDDEDRKNAKPEIDWLVEVKKAKDNNQMNTAQTNAAAPPPMSNMNNTNTTTNGVVTTRYNINDFRCVDDNGITTFPTELVGALNRFHADTQKMPRCARNGGRKMSVGKPDQLALWCAAGADEELKTGQFKLAGTRYNFFVLQGPSLARGRPVLVGEVCQGQAFDHSRPDGTVWARRNYHVWTPARDSHNENLDCSKAEVFKLLEKGNKECMAPSPSPSVTNEEDETPQELARKYFGSDNEFQPLESRQAGLKRRIGSSDTEETRLTEDDEPERKRSKANEEIRMRELSINTDIPDRSRAETSTARPISDAVGTINESPASAHHRYFMPPVATSQGSSRRASTANGPLSNQHFEHFFAFRHTTEGPSLRQKLVRICPDVETLFVHAMEASIADTNIWALWLLRPLPSVPVTIVKGDDEEYQKFVKQLSNALGVEQILVIPKTYG